MVTDDKNPKRIEDLNPKDKLIGTVVKTMLAGVIVDIGLDIPGVVHISRIQEIVGGSRQIQQYIMSMALRQLFKML